MQTGTYTDGWKPGADFAEVFGELAEVNEGEGDSGDGAGGRETPGPVQSLQSARPVQTERVAIEFRQVVRTHVIHQGRTTETKIRDQCLDFSSLN